jgi:hypothetical protein
MDGSKSKDTERENPSGDKCHICNKVFESGEGRYRKHNGAVCLECHEQNNKDSIEHKDY